MIFTLFLMFCSVPITSFASGDQRLDGVWLLQSEIPTYYEFSEDGRFLVNFVNPQTKRIMAVAAGAYKVDGRNLTLIRDGVKETLTQSFKVEGEKMTWETHSDMDEYDQQISLNRVEVELYTPEVFYAEDNADVYNTYLK